MKYKAAVIGCGRIGFGFDSDPKRRYVATHTGAYVAVKDTTLVAVCDTDRRKLVKCQQRWPGVKGYTDLRLMFRKERIDIVSICTPADTHYPVLKEVVKFPVKAVFCEKPMAGNLKDAARMIKLCKKKEIILQIDHQRRFDILHNRIRSSINKKKFGEARQVNFYYTAGISNTGSHMFDLLRFFFGEVEWIEAMNSKSKSRRVDDPNLDGMLKFKKGFFATFQACDVKDYFIFEMNCFFDRSRMVLKNSGFDLDFFKVANSRYFSGYKELCKAASPFNTRYRKNFMVSAVKNLVDCVKYRRNSVSSGYDGFKDLELIEAALVSARNNGRRIYLR